MFERVDAGQLALLRRLARSVLMRESASINFVPSYIPDEELRIVQNLLTLSPSTDDAGDAASMAFVCSWSGTKEIRLFMSDDLASLPHKLPMRLPRVRD